MGGPAAGALAAEEYNQQRVYSFKEQTWKNQEAFRDTPFTPQVTEARSGRAKRQRSLTDAEILQVRCRKGVTATRPRPTGRCRPRSSCLLDNSNDRHSDLLARGRGLIATGLQSLLTGPRDKSARTLPYSKFLQRSTSRRRSTTDLIRRGRGRPPTGSKITSESSRSFRKSSGSRAPALILKVRSPSTSCSYPDTRGAPIPGQATSRPHHNSSVGSFSKGSAIIRRPAISGTNPTRSSAAWIGSSANAWTGNVMPTIENPKVKPWPASTGSPPSRSSKGRQTWGALCTCGQNRTSLLQVSGDATEMIL